MLMLKIAFRNIFRQKRRSILTALSMFGGFVLAAFFIGFSDGTYNDIINTFTRHQTGQIQVHHSDWLAHPTLYKTIDHPAEIEKVLGQMDKVDSWTPRLYSAGLASVGEKSTGVRIIGIDPEKEDRTTTFNEKIISGSMFTAENANEAIIGKGLVKLLNAAVKEDVVIVSQGADGSIANDRYKIVGIVESGDEISDRSSIYLPLATAQELLVMGKRVHEIAITVHSLYDVAPVSKALEKKIAAGASNLAVEPWQVFARSFYIAMQADKKGMWITLLIIVLVVAVGVLNTVLMSVLERRREYGVLKAVGTKPGQIIKMVLLEVNILGILCIVLGTAVGLLINYYFSLHGISMPEPMTYGGIKFQHMFTEINIRSFYIPAVTVLLSATLVGLFPALKAAHTDPARSMRIH
jgi:putative ABC transport system permease protein